MELSVIIPAYNEAATIGIVLKRIFALKVDFAFEVIVVDDGSTDGTAKAVEGAGFPVTLVRQETNQGKGSVVRKGIEKASGRFTIIQDADLEYDPRDYAALMRPALAGEAEVIYGSRILNRQNRRSYKRFYWGGRLLSWWTNLLYGSEITDESTCYKLFKTTLLRSLKLKSNGFEFCPEVTAKVLKRGIKITEVPISYEPRSIEEGKKITWMDGFHALWVLFALRFYKD